MAVFGLGDQKGYPDAFVNALGELFDVVSGYRCQHGRLLLLVTISDSTALDGDDFVGLVIDQDNQADMTAERVTSWVASIKPLMGL